MKTQAGDLVWQNSSLTESDTMTSLRSLEQEARTAPDTASKWLKASATLATPTTSSSLIRSCSSRSVTSAFNCFMS